MNVLTPKTKVLYIYSILCLGILCVLLLLTVLKQQFSLSQNVSFRQGSEVSFSQMEIFAIRLSPGEELKSALEHLVKKHQIEAGCILSVVGSLQKVALRYANQSETTILKDKFEILSLSGTLSTDGSHLHLSVSDSQGTTYGGHLKEGNEVYTTAEILIGVFPEVRFLRELDQTYGYKELTIQKK